jgi:queuosine precursor transporter
MNELLFFGWMIVGLASLVVSYRLFGKAGIVALIVGNVVIMNVLVTKGVEIFGLGATAGNVLYGMIFLGTDMISEFHGGKEARKAVLLGFSAAVVALLASMAALWMAPAPWDWAHGSLVTILSPVPRIVLGSWIAYLISQTFDTYAYDFWKKRGAPIWVRNNGSTLVSQAIDSVLFCSIALIGTMPTEVWVQVLLSTYLLKVLVAIVDTPFLYIANRLRR